MSVCVVPVWLRPLPIYSIVFRHPGWLVGGEYNVLQQTNWVSNPILPDLKSHSIHLKSLVTRGIWKRKYINSSTYSLRLVTFHCHFHSFLLLWPQSGNPRECRVWGVGRGKLFRISSFVYSRWKKFIEFWNKWGWVNYDRIIIFRWTFSSLLGPLHIYIWLHTSYLSVKQYPICYHKCLWFCVAMYQWCGLCCRNQHHWWRGDPCHVIRASCRSRLSLFITVYLDVAPSTENTPSLNNLGPRTQTLRGLV